MNSISPEDSRPEPGRTFSRAWPILILPFLACSALLADIVVLTNGREIQGEIIHEGKDALTLRFPGGTLRLQRRRVREVRRQSRLAYLVDEGRKALTRGDYLAAISALEKAREESPDSDRARKELTAARREYAEVLSEENRFGKALEIYGHILRDDPGNAPALKERELILDARDEAELEVELAREEMRSGDLQGSLARFRKIYREYPDSRQDIARDLSIVSIRRARDLTVRRRWKEAAELLHAAVTIEPELINRVRGPFVMCKVRELAPFLRRGEFAAVEPIVRQGLDVDPSNEQLLYYLALSWDAQGKTREAGETYASILGEPPRSYSLPEIAELRARVEKQVIKDDGAFRVFFEQKAGEVLPGDFRSIATDHFVVRHRNNTVGAEVSRVAEIAYNDLFRRLGCTTHWRTPCEIVVYPTADLYRENTRVGAWSGASHELTRGRGVFTQHRIASHQKQAGLTTGVLQHEIAHAMLAHRLNYPRHLPLWANEGFAVSEGPGYLRAYYRRLVEQARLHRSLIPLSLIVAADSYPDPQEIPLFYGQCYTVVRYLIRQGGVKKFIAFLKDCATGGPSSLETALRKHYRFHSLSALENRWRGSLTD